MPVKRKSKVVVWFPESTAVLCVVHSSKQHYRTKHVWTCYFAAGFSFL